MLKQKIIEILKPVYNNEDYYIEPTADEIITEFLKLLQHYQGGFVIEHYRGPEEPPEPEFAPEFGVIEDLINFIKINNLNK